MLSCEESRSTMTSPENGRNLDGMRPVLFPMRTFSSPDGIEGHPQDATASSNAAGVRWVCLDPLKLVESLAATTEEREGHVFEPVRINDITLSSPISVLPAPANANGESSANEALVVPSLPPWDPSFLLFYDGEALPTAERIQSLAETLESASHYSKVLPSYRRVRDHLAHTSGWIHHHCSSDASNERARLLGILYAETIQQMEALIETTQNMAKQDKAAARHPTSKAALKPEAKRNFAEYMSQWLKDNWTNPYPDDECLAEIASDCDTTPTVVSNWLINARTRKWRPALQKAFKLKRPADLLQEDSIRIFEGNPVRNLDDDGDATCDMIPPANKRRRHS